MSYFVVFIAYRNSRVTTNYSTTIPLSKKPPHATVYSVGVRSNVLQHICTWPCSPHDITNNIVNKKVSEILGVHIYMQRNAVWHHESCQASEKHTTSITAYKHRMSISYRWHIAAVSCLLLHVTSRSWQLFPLWTTNQRRWAKWIHLIIHMTLLEAHTRAE